jgi:hypothetical protein
MSKLIGFLLLAIGAVVLVPALRERAMPHVAPALDPFYSWSARNRVSEIVDLLHEEETLGRTIPAPRDFAEFVDRRDMKKGASLDPWGTPFYLQLTRRTYLVGSAGKDRVPRTADDILSEPQPRKGAPRR